MVRGVPLYIKCIVAMSRVVQCSDDLTIEESDLLILYQFAQPLLNVGLFTRHCILELASFNYRCLVVLLVAMLMDGLLEISESTVH